MINYIHALLHRPEKGWDPISEAHANEYESQEWKWFDNDMVRLLDAVEAKAGPLAGLRILDLGGGPGQWSVALAKRGATVVWHDISARYRSITQRKAAEHGVADQISYSLGYLEESKRLELGSFDLIWCRICWYYCMNDAAFARILFELAKPNGGAAWIQCPQFPVTSLKGKLIKQLNAITGIKIGHPCPPPGRIAHLFRKLGAATVEAETLPYGDEQVFFRR